MPANAGYSKTPLDGTQARVTILAVAIVFRDDAARKAVTLPKGMLAHRKVVARAEIQTTTGPEKLNF